MGCMGPMKEGQFILNNLRDDGYYFNFFLKNRSLSLKKLSSARCSIRDNRSNTEMKIFTAVAILQFLILVAEARVTPPEDSKKVVCFYLSPMTILNGTLDIEDIDSSICTHLLVDESIIEQMIEECGDGNYTGRNRSSDGMLQKLQSLKAVNPDLKLIVQILYRHLFLIRDIWGSSDESNITHDAVRLLKEMGFDGLNFKMDTSSQKELDELADVICEMGTEFDKNGFIITTFLSENETIRSSHDLDYGKVVSCCDHVSVLSPEIAVNVTVRLSSLNKMKSAVDFYSKRGFPLNKMVMTVSAFGYLFALEDPQDTGLGARMDLKRTPSIGEGFLPGLIFHKELQRALRNSSLEWTIIRDEHSQEPYAFTKTGLWASYDDVTSMQEKANYVLKHGLGGISILPINVEDIDGEEGRFPLTRVAYNTLHGPQTEDKNL